MKLSRFTVIALVTAFFCGILGGCTAEEPADNRERDYGYIQFKLYKEASYDDMVAGSEPSTKAVTDRLDYLAEASKVKVTLEYGETTIAQTLQLSASGKEEAEFGMRSDKLKLLAGEYTVKLFSLYDANDELLYNGADENPSVVVVEGGLTVHDLLVDVTPRGKVKFTLMKDMDFKNTPATKAPNREYTFDEIKTFSITVQNRETFERTTFEKLTGKFSIHFDEDPDTFGYQTSSIVCDSLLSLPAGSYEVYSYQTYDSNKILLETNSRPNKVEFTVADNRVTEVRPEIKLYESDEYIKDGYALYEIWKALDGPNWYGSGESDVQGSNWNFNKDPDLWCDQPGVQIHANGRVARISIGDFGFRGHMPAAIGQLTELIELYLGTHNDNQGNVTHTYDPTLDFSRSLGERTRNRMENHKEFLRAIHPATQVSEPVAIGLAMKNISIPATALYEQGYKAEDIFDMKTGRQLQIRPMDMNHGKLTNGLKSLPAEIGKLTKLEYLYIANGELEELPAELGNLENLTDIELYNCPKMTKFPMALTQLKNIVSLNISNNRQWSAEEIYKGLDGLATGPSNEKIQILYARQNSLVELPASFRNMKKIGLLDLAYNRISILHPLGKDVAPVQLYLDNNELAEIPVDENGIFCTLDDTETVSLTHNKLTVFPNLFTSKTQYVLGSVDCSFNQITGFPEDFRGINVETLTLAGNPIKKFPTEFAETDSQVAYIILRGCEVEEIEEGSFNGKYSNYLVSFDLSYNHLKDLPKDFTADKLPYLYGLDISYNSFSEFPWEPLNCSGLTVFALRCQRDDNGERCLREWPTGIYQHVGLRALLLGSNDLRKIDDTISPNIFMLDISDNPNITFDASDICYYWQAGAYSLIYDKTQNIIGCAEMLM